MAGPIRTRIEIDADARQAIGELGDVERAALDADAAVERLDAATVTIDVDESQLVTGLNKVEKSADSSKSVLANMVGNTTQDLGALGGVAGSAGVAIGQMGEYMADAAAAGENLGSVVGNFARVAGPIAALSAGVAIATAAWGAYKKNQAEAAEQAEKLLEVTKQLSDQKYADAAQTLADAYAGLFEDLAARGVTATRAVQFITGAVDDLGVEEEASRQLLEDNNTEFSALVQHAIKARDTFASQNRELGDQRDLTGEIEDTLATIYDTVTSTTPAWQQVQNEIDRAAGRVDRFGDDGVENMGDVEEATDDTADSVRSLADEFDFLLGKLDKRAAMRNVSRQFDEMDEAARAAWIAVNEGAEDAGEKQRDFADSLDDTIRALIDAGAPRSLIATITAQIGRGELEQARFTAEAWLAAHPIEWPVELVPLVNTMTAARQITAEGNVRLTGAPPSPTYRSTPVSSQVTIINPPGTPATTVGAGNIYVSRNGVRTDP